MAVLTANLQRKKHFSRRLKRLRKRTRASFGTCISLLQELLTPASGLEVSEAGLFHDEEFKTGVLLPAELEGQFVRSGTGQRWTCVQVGCTQYASLYLHVAETSEKVEVSEAILRDVSCYQRTSRSWP